MARDPRLDAARGFALATIALTHIPGLVYADWTLRRWGFSDAAEIFVLVSGLALGMAYARWDLARWIAAAGKRVATLLAAHLALTAGGLAVAGLAGALGATTLMGRHGMAPVFEGSIDHLVGLALLTHQLGYINILPLYMALVAAAPLVLWGARRAPGATVAASLALWAVAGAYDIGPLQWPGDGRWQFNPLAWQAIFVIGVVVGARMVWGTPWRPRHPAAATTAAAGFLLLAFIWRTVPEVQGWGRAALEPLWTHPLGAQLFGFHKPDLAGMRLLHALALAWCVAALPWGRAAAAHTVCAPLRALGRHGLTVFCMGTLLSYAGQAVLLDTPPFFGRDTLLAGAVLGALWALAIALDAWETHQGRRRADLAHPTPSASRKGAHAPQHAPQA